jgi:hypothetical protein
VTPAPAILRDVAAISAASGQFRHRERLELVWRYVRRPGSAGGGESAVRGLRRLAELQRRPFDEERTRFWVGVVARAIELHPDLGFDELLETHPQLLDPRLPDLAPLLDCPQ